jgi:hypothetical protein
VGLLGFNKVIHDPTELDWPVERAGRPPMTTASWALPLAGLSLVVAVVGTIRLQLGLSATWRTLAVCVGAFLFALIVLSIAVAYGQ